MYRRLMSVVDDYGRYHGSPLTIRAGCWPTCPEKINHSEVVDWLEECCRGPKPLIVLYSVDGAKYLQITDFKQQTRSKSKFPDPESGLISDCEQNACTSRISYSYSETQTQTDAPLPRLPSTSEYPETAAAIRAKDPACDDLFVRRLTTVVLQSALSDDSIPPGEVEKITDQIIADAVKESFATFNGKKNHGTGLLLTRVPQIVRNWCKEPDE